MGGRPSLAGLLAYSRARVAVMSKERKPKDDRGLSLAPLTFGEALDALLKVKPDEDRPAKHRKKKRKPAEQEQSDD